MAWDSFYPLLISERQRPAITWRAVVVGSTVVVQGWYYLNALA